MYKFHRTVKVDTGGVVTAGEELNPSEGQFVMKKGAFKFGDSVEIVLDKEGEAVASRQTVREKDAFGSWTQKRSQLTN